MNNDYFVLFIAMDFLDVPYASDECSMLAISDYL